MRRLTSTSDIKQLGTILGVWAHPDDETFTSAGIMATAIQNGQQVICVTATNGEAGVQDELRWPANNLAEIRKHELAESLKITGVSNQHELGFKDGSCLADDDQGIDKVCNLIEKYQPNTILTFNKDGMTGHTDHIAVCNWALSAKIKTQTQAQIYHAVLAKEQYGNSLRTLDEELNIFFNLEQPNFVNAGNCDIYFKLSPELQELKFKAIEAMPSQTAKMLQDFEKRLICDAFLTEVFIKHSD